MTLHSNKYHKISMQLKREVHLANSEGYDCTQNKLGLVIFIYLRMLQLCNWKKSEDTHQ
jgi:hypothetical protein